MKTKLLFLLILLSVFAFSQRGTIKVKKVMPNLAGVWDVTNYSDFKQFHDIWEFRADGTVAELKYCDDGALPDCLLPDGHGTWHFENDTLTLFWLGEKGVNDEDVTYASPYIWKINVNKKEDFLVMYLYGKENEKIKFVKRK